MSTPHYRVGAVDATGAACDRFAALTADELQAEVERLEQLDCDCEAEYFTDRAAPVVLECRRCRELRLALEEKDERTRAEAEWRAELWRDANDFARKETP